MKNLAVSLGAGTETLDPHQLRFQRLVGDIENARQELAAWREAADIVQRQFHDRIDPLARAFVEKTLGLLERFDTILVEAKPRTFTKAELAALRHLCFDVADTLLHHAFSTPEQCAAVEAIIARHSQPLTAKQQAQEIDLMRAFGAMVGIDLDDVDTTSPEELLKTMQARIDEARQQRPPKQRTESDVGEDDDAGGPAGGPTPGRGPRRTPRQEKLDAERSKSLREVYLQLARELHPDRATNDGDRERRTALMARVNTAYEAKDLLTLLMLQLELAQLDADQIRKQSTAKIKHFNQLLSAQLKQLKEQKRHLQDDFYGRFGIHIARTKDLGRLDKLVNEQVRRFEALIARVEADQRIWSSDTASIKVLLRHVRFD